MSAAGRAWPAALAETPVAAVLERAISGERLSHSLLLHGDDAEALAGIAFAIADRLLNVPEAGAAYPPERHPDCFQLRPTGKLRVISADAVRGLIGQVQVSASVAPRKVAILHEAERMNAHAANIFLKTLEEPPPRTTLLLLTTRPYALLPTIRSRMLHFRFPHSSTPIEAEGWTAWLEDYRSWLRRLAEGIADRQAAAEGIFALYGLVARFGPLLEQAAAAAWKRQREALPAELDEDEQTALETGAANGLRARLLAELERATFAFAQERWAAGDESAGHALPAAIERLERVAGLLRVNLNESAALEDFLLASLRLWTKKPA